MIDFSMCNIIVPSLKVNITGVGVPLAGQRYSLTCNIISGSEGLISSTITYKWTKDSSTEQTGSNILEFSPLKLSDGGLYTCEIALNSSALMVNATTSVSYALEVSSKY